MEALLKRLERLLVEIRDVADAQADLNQRLDIIQTLIDELSMEVMAHVNKLD